MLLLYQPLSRLLKRTHNIFILLLFFYRLCLKVIFLFNIRIIADLNIFNIEKKKNQQNNKNNEPNKMSSRKEHLKGQTGLRSSMQRSAWRREGSGMNLL